MVYKIKYHKLGNSTFLDNLDYLEQNWSKRLISSYLDRIDKIIALIEINPEVFPKWKDNLIIRKVVIVKQITMFYEIKKETINILLFWNNYQNPNNLIELLNK